jgi:hypothetical protein
MRTIHDIASPADAVAFFQEGRERVRRARAQARSRA